MSKKSELAVHEKRVTRDTERGLAYKTEQLAKEAKVQSLKNFKESKSVKFQEVLVQQGAASTVVSGSCAAAGYNQFDVKLHPVAVNAENHAVNRRSLEEIREISRKKLEVEISKLKFETEQLKIETQQIREELSEEIRRYKAQTEAL